MRSRFGWMLLGAVVALRLPLLLRPGLGRDEALYLHWSQHPDPSYAPLLQVLLHGSLLLGAHAPWSVRSSGLVVSLLGLVLLDRLLRAHGQPDPPRRVALALFAFSPWQTIVGSFVHPDALQWTCVLGFALAVRRRSWMATALWAAAAALAKPSGALVGVVALGLLVRPDRRALGALLVASATVLPWLFAPPERVAGLLEFGQVTVEIVQRGGLFLLGSFVLAGPVVPVAACVGGIERIRARSFDPVTLTGLLYVLAFGLAAGWNGQVKGNWMLPAAALLWPLEHRARRWPWVRVGIGITLATSLLLVAALCRPAWVLRAERAAGEALPDYLLVAGHRELEVSSARRWWHRCAEYGDASAFHARIHQRWNRPFPPAFVISDDYGLAAQFAVSGPTPWPPLVLPLDPVFARRGPISPGEGLLIAARAPVEALARGRAVRALGRIHHPVTGEPIALAVVLAESP